MNSSLKIILPVILVGFGIGIYAIYGGAGNDQSAENNASSEASVTEALKPFAKGEMAAMRILDKPLDLTQLNFTDGGEKKFTIADWKGRTVLLNLWATWCPPCRHEMPFLEALEKELGGDKFEVVTVSIDLKSPDKPKAFFSEINLKELGFYWDGSSKIFNDLKKMNLAFGMPTTVLIDQNGMALSVLNGPANWHSKDSVAMINKALELAN